MTITHEQLLEDLYAAYLDARRHKRSTHNQLKFEVRQEREVLALFEAIAARTYVPKRSVAFIVNRPVQREVFCADFSDRVVHHLLYNYINPLFERTFISTSFSCRKGKGTLYGVRTLQQHMAQCTEDYTQQAYVLKLDIKGYFMNIDRQRLYDKLEQTLLYYRHKPVNGELKVENEECSQSAAAQQAETLSALHSPHSTSLTWDERLDYDLVLFLLRQIVFNDPVTGCLMKSPRSAWQGLLPNKSLFNQPAGVGLPIGNLTSQLFSNIYLNRFDHWVTRELGCPYYGRYVDDFYIMHRDADFLKSLIPKIRDFLKLEFGLTLHPNKIYFQSCSRGVAFLGAYIKGKKAYAGKRLCNHFKATARECMGDNQNEQRAVTRMNSYLGLLLHYNTRKLRKKMLDRFGYRKQYVVCGERKIKIRNDKEKGIK